MILLTLSTGERIEIDADDIDETEPALDGAVVHRCNGATLLVKQNARTLQTRVDTERVTTAPKVTTTPKVSKSFQPEGSAATVPAGAAVATKPANSFGSRSKRPLLTEAVFRLS